MRIIKCTGNGQGSCKRCSDNGIWNSTWCCFLYHFEGHDETYHYDCIKEIAKENGYDIE